MRGTPFVMEGWTGGLNTISNPYLVQQNESRDLLNVVSTERGSIRKRYGAKQFITGAEQLAKLSGVSLLTMFPCIVQGDRYLLVASTAKIWSVSMGGVVEEIGKGFTSGRWSMVQAPKTKSAGTEYGPIYMVNGKDKPQTWTGSPEVKEWTGLASHPEFTDGETQQLTSLLKSKTAKFIPEMVGLEITFTGEPEMEMEEGETKRSSSFIIESVISSEVAQLALPGGARGFKNTEGGLKFKIEQGFYKEGEHVPNGKYMIFFGNRIWMTGIENDPSAVWFSELASIGEGGSQCDPSQWPSSNVVRFDSSDENPITAIGTVGPYLLVFKDEKTWVIHDINTGANRRISSIIGCVANRSVVESPHGTFFLTKDSGIYLTNGSSVTEMSYNVRPTITNITPSQRGNAAGAYFNNHYYLSFAYGGATTNNRTFDYDMVLKSWWLHDLAGPQWALQEPSEGHETLFILPTGISKGVAEAFKEGIYTDLGVNYVGNGTMGAYFLTNWEPFAYYIFRHRAKAPFLKKRVRQIFFNGEGSIIPAVFKDFTQGETQESAVVGNNEIATSLENPVDFAASEEKWGEGIGEWGEEVPGTEKLWGGEVTVGQARIYAPGVAFTWSVGWGNNSAEPFIVDNFTYMLTFRKS